MDKMQFMMFQWEQNPEFFRIDAVCVPEYELTSDGRYEYQGLGPLIRVISGRGVFCGEDAVQQFNALAVIMAARREGELHHPVWGDMTACLTELNMEQEGRDNHINYSFTFRETDGNGTIPRLPEIDERT